MDQLKNFAWLAGAIVLALAVVVAVGHIAHAL